MRPRGHAEDRPLPARGRAVVVATVVATLTTCMVVGILGSMATEHGADQTRRAVAVSAAFEQVGAGLAVERSLEREYRLDPGPRMLGQVHTAQAAVFRDLTAVAEVGSTDDAFSAGRVQAEHTGYLDAVDILVAAADSRESSASIDGIESGVVDPIFQTMESEVQRAVAAHQASALTKAVAMRRTGRIVFAVDAAALIGGVALLSVAALSLARSQRRLRAQSALTLHQSLHDSLTGLPNRAQFHDHAAHVLHAGVGSGSRVAVLVIDLNRFKEVNDTLGHHYGDLLLEQVARRFEVSVRVGDCVARLGGDEFAVLLTDPTPGAAVAVAQRLTDVLREPFRVRDMTLDVEASIGVAFADGSIDVEAALRHADVAMYEAKSHHLPFATYELTRDANTIARLTLLGDLRRAVGNGELVLDFQPKVSATTGALHSVEALVRWHHPTRGVLSPDVFIPVAEATAVIHPLTTEVLRQALAQAHSWLDQGRRIPIAVNVSARSLLDLSFPDQVRRLLDAYDVPAGLLTIELTESAFMRDHARALTVLDALNTMGICLSIDDFGTGYSSMAYLKALPVRELKIDRSFVRGMANNESDTVLVRSAVELGHNLGLHVVAEGVEDVGTLQSLSSMGCDLVQGYFVQRPASARDLEPWLRDHVVPAGSVLTKVGAWPHA
jgi:diguanylate cyclase (GGDEF)-like protein